MHTVGYKHWVPARATPNEPKSSKRYLLEMFLSEMRSTSTESMQEEDRAQTQAGTMCKSAGAPTPRTHTFNRVGDLTTLLVSQAPAAAATVSRQSRKFLSETQEHMDTHHVFLCCNMPTVAAAQRQQRTGATNGKLVFRQVPAPPNTLHMHIVYNEMSLPPHPRLPQVEAA